MGLLDLPERRSSMRQHTAFIIAVTLALWPEASRAAEPAGPPTLSAGQRAALEDGEVIVAVTREDTANRAEVIAVIDGAPADVFAVITDFSSYERWVADQVESVVVSGEAGRFVLQGETRVPVFRNRTYRLDDVHRTEVIDGHTVYIDEWDYIQGSGNMDENEGFWIVMPYNGDEARSLIRMVLYADLGMLLPPAVINWGTRRALPNLVAGIQSETSRRNP